MHAAARLLVLLLAGLTLALTIACGGGGGEDDGEQGTSTPRLTATGSGRETPGPTDGGAAATPGPTEPGGSDGDGTGSRGVVVSIPRARAAVGQTVTAELFVRGFPEPGLGAWTIDITYDPDVLSNPACEPEGGTSVCNPEYPDKDNTIRLAGATAQGLVGDSGLMTMTFTCANAGTSALEISVDTFADASVGNPQRLEPAVENGEVTCQ